MLSFGETEVGSSEGLGQVVGWLFLDLTAL